MITIHALVPIPNIKQYLFAKVSAGPMGSQVLSWCPSLHIEPRCSGRKNLAKEWMGWMGWMEWMENWMENCVAIQKMETLQKWIQHLWKMRWKNGGSPTVSCWVPQHS